MPSVSKRDKEQSIIRNLDWFTLFIFVVLVAMGWMSVCGASYDFDQGGQLLDFSSRSGMQMESTCCKYWLKRLLKGNSCWPS